MSTTTSSPPAKEGGASLMDMIALAKVYLRELMRNFWIVLIFMGLIGGYLYYRKAKDPTIYTASFTFVLNEETDMSKSMLGVLGLDILRGGEYSSNNLNLQKMEELMTTRYIMGMTLFSREKMKMLWKEPKEDYLINHYLNWFWYHGDTSGVYFRRQDSVNFAKPIDWDVHFTRDENARLLSIYSTILRSQFKKFASAAGMMNISFQSNSEEFSYVFVRTLYKRLNEYYNNKSVEKQYSLYMSAKHRVDSLETVLGGAEAGYYNYLNAHNLYTRQNVAIAQQRLNRRLQSETEAYLMSLRNEEIAKIAWEQQKMIPVIQPIDQPIYPLAATVPSPLTHLIIGSVVGFVLGSGFVLGRKYFRDLLQKNAAKKGTDAPSAPPTPA